MEDRRARCLLANLIPELAPAHWRRLLEAFGDLDRLWTAGGSELERVGLSPRLAQALVEGRVAQGRLERELALAQRLGVRLITLEDDDYPALLRTIPDPPLVLSLLGTLTGTDAAAVAIVGARQASAYGLACAGRLAEDLAHHGLTVISGLAFGIDRAAHEGALKGGGRTIAVLGSGLARIYPPQHAALATRIAQQGALLSEYPLQTAPLPYHFPRRNRLLSGLSRGVVVVEAAQRSGALITADCALEQGREVFAVPGPMTSVTSQGTHALLKQGARLVTSVEDILEELGLARPVPRLRAVRARAASVAGLSDRTQRVLACLAGDSPHHIDVIAEASGCPMAEVASALLDLELKRLVKQLPGKRFVRE